MKNSNTSPDPDSNPTPDTTPLRTLTEREREEFYSKYDLDPGLELSDEEIIDILYPPQRNLQLQGHPLPHPRLPKPGVKSLPAIAMSDLAAYLGVSYIDLGKLCASDPERFPTFYSTQHRTRGRRMVGMGALHQVLEAIHPLTGQPLDRIGLLMWMADCDNPLMDFGEAQRLRARPFYEEKVEREIERIAKLPEPARTLQGLAFWERFRDAAKLRNIRKHRKEDHARRRAPRVVEQLGKRLVRILAVNQVGRGRHARIATEEEYLALCELESGRQRRQENEVSSPDSSRSETPSQNPHPTD